MAVLCWWNPAEMVQAIKPAAASPIRGHCTHDKQQSMPFVRREGWRYDFGIEPGDDLNEIGLRSLPPHPEVNSPAHSNQMQRHAQPKHDPKTEFLGFVPKHLLARQSTRPPAK